MKTTLTFVLLSFLLVGCGRRDAAIQKELTGTWTYHSKIGSNTFAFASNSSYHCHWTTTVAGKTRTGTEDGTWQIKDGLLITTMTSNDVDMQIPPPETNRIIRLDGQEVVLQIRKNMRAVYSKIKL